MLGSELSLPDVHGVRQSQRLCEKTHETAEKGWTGHAISTGMQRLPWVSSFTYVDTYIKSRDVLAADGYQDVYTQTYISLILSLSQA